MKTITEEIESLMLAGDGYNSEYNQTLQKILNRVEELEGKGESKPKAHLPKDILCEVWANGCEASKHARYSDGNGNFLYNGVDSSFGGSLFSSWDNFKVIENPIRPWLNDAECPIPEGLNFRVFIDGHWDDNCRYCWEWNGASIAITAYQVLGEE